MGFGLKTKSDTPRWNWHRRRTRCDQFIEVERWQQVRQVFCNRANNV